VKVLRNKRKHGIAFEEAVTLFGDLLAETFLDHDSREGEERWVIIGLTKRRTPDGTRRQSPWNRE
jgi:uncharacterized DUF497 family protein